MSLPPTRMLSNSSRNGEREFIGWLCNVCLLEDKALYKSGNADLCRNEISVRVALLFVIGGLGHKLVPRRCRVRSEEVWTKCRKRVAKDMTFVNVPRFSHARSSVEPTGVVVCVVIRAVLGSFVSGR